MTLNVESIQKERDKYQDECRRLEREREMDAKTIQALRKNLTQVVEELSALQAEYDRIERKYTRIADIVHE